MVKKSTTPRRTWSEKENQQCLQYMKSTIQDGKQLEKPTANVYFGKALDSLKFSDCTVTQLKNQVRNLKKKFCDAVQWRNQTGQGVLADEGEETFHSELNAL